MFTSRPRALAQLLSVLFYQQVGTEKRAALFMTIHNDKHAKDAIRTVRFSYNRGEVPTSVEFSDALAPEGWERTVVEGTGFFTGELKPGGTATFAVTSTLEPERSLLVISGIDHKARPEEREAIVAQGASLRFFRYIANQLGNREYRVFPLRDHGKLEPLLPWAGNRPRQFSR